MHASKVSSGCDVISGSVWWSVLVIALLAAGACSESLPPLPDAGARDSTTPRDSTVTDGTAGRDGIGPGGCEENSHCPPTTGGAQFCYFDKGCGDQGPGECQPVPQSCDANYAPVCGCDNKEYGNACVAQLSGTSVAFDGFCAPAACVSDSDCTVGAQWCEGGACVPCDNSALNAVCAPCEEGMVSYKRNGCESCACVPKNPCTSDGECPVINGQPGHCYPGAFCYDWCSPGDPSCCHGNVCSASGCPSAPPVGCKVRGCPVGQYCDTGKCGASSCNCDHLTASWVCTKDCGGGACVPN